MVFIDIRYCRIEYIIYSHRRDQLYLNVSSNVKASINRILTNDFEYNNIRLYEETLL